jgi:hypothetical protein
MPLSLSCHFPDFASNFCWATSVTLLASGLGLQVEQDQASYRTVGHANQIAVPTPA